MLNKRNFLPTLPLVAVIASTVNGTVAYAQETLILEEIIVTARLRAESLQSTPLSITALSGDYLEQRNITDVRSLMDQTPGVYFTNQGGPGLGNVSLRGVTQGSLIGDEANVASFVDGFYWSGRIAFDGFLDGLNRVEVIRGPQSALYGRNSFSGAINYVTKKPDMEDLGGGIKLSYGNEGRREYSANLSLPVVKDVLGLRIDASHMETGSTLKNSVNGARLNDAESDNFRIQLKYTPNDAVNIDYAFTYVDRETSDQPLFSVPYAELDSGIRSDFISFSFRNHKTRFPTARPDADMDRHVSALIGNTYDVERHTFRFDYDFENFVFSALLAHTEEEIVSIQDATYGRGGDVILANIFDISNPTAPPNFVPVDLDGNMIPDTFPVVGGQPIQDREDFSAEIRFQSRSDGRLSWDFGGFFSRLKYTDLLLTGYDVSDATLNAALAYSPAPFPQINVGIFPATYNCNPMDPAACPMPMVIDTWGVEGGIQTLQEKYFENESASVFASFGYEISDRTNITVEMRYTQEDRLLEDRVEVTGLYDSSFPAPISEDYDTFTPRVIVDHQWNDDVFLYASAGKGAKAGGVQPSSSGGRTLYDPEENWTYEIGSKLNLLNGRMIVNVAAFFVDWTDMQLRENIGLDNIVTNIGEAEVKGFEILAAHKVHENVQMRYGYTYQDGEIKEGSTASAAGFCDLPHLEHVEIPVGFGNPIVFGSDPDTQAACGFEFAPAFVDGEVQAGTISVTTGNIAGNRLANAPRTNFVYGVDVNIPMTDSLSFFTNVDVNYRSQTYLDFENWTEIGSTTLVNAQLGVQSEKWRLFVWGENITDEDTLTGAIRNFNILGQSGTTVQHRNGQMFGLTLSGQF